VTHKVVVGVDGSAHSAAALRWALANAVKYSGEVTALLAWQMPFVSIPGAFDRDELSRTYKEFLLKTVAEVAPAPEVPVHTVVAEGDPIEALVAAAQDADLLVLGTRGRSLFAGLLLGSVSQACAAHARCPVVLVKRDSEAPVQA
jgi:nucleotide-binding universal stress UspA family protein